jgi:threonine dehydratase
VIGIEPEGACAMTKSLAEGKPVHLEKVETVADGLAAPFSGAHTLDRVQRFVDEIVLVSDEEILEAMRLIIERCTVVPEPAAAAAFAALRSGRAKTPVGKRVVCVLSGGNVDCARLKSLL